MTTTRLNLEPVPALIQRVRAELAADFPPSKPMRISRAPGRLDVMGGIADYTGSLVCEMPLDRAAAVALSERADRDLQVFSFNLHDEHKPFTFRIPLDALAEQPLDALRRELQEPGRAWAGYLAGCLFILHEQGLLDLRDPKHTGVNLALLSSVPLGAGVSSSAAIEVATMMNLLDHFNIPRADLRAPDSRGREPAGLDALEVASLCQQVENRVVGAPCGIMDQVTSCAGEAGTLLRMVCQPHVLQPPLKLPDNVRVVGINSNVKHSVGGGAYGRTRCAAFMAHKMILEQMRRAGQTMGRELASDPMNGYLANLDPEDYKKHFRPRLPEFMNGSDFLRDYKATIDTATTVQPDEIYPVQHAADHHVLEAQRVQHFVEYLEEAAEHPVKKQAALNRAGHLMYASHLSYTNDAMLGADECDLLVDLVRAHEHAGLYGAKITGGGSGGTVAVLAATTARASGAIADILRTYEQQTGHKPELFNGTSAGAWQAGTAVI
jgi:L-arabinokinase